MFLHSVKIVNPTCGVKTSDSTGMRLHIDFRQFAENVQVRTVILHSVLF